MMDWGTEELEAHFRLRKEDNKQNEFKPQSREAQRKAERRRVAAERRTGKPRKSKRLS
jgi:hypothetical protein